MPTICARKPDFAKRGYAGGVPMGGDLPRRRRRKAPRFAVWALRDPGVRARRARRCSGSRS
jgi:hypothetical protein